MDAAVCQCMTHHSIDTGIYFSQQNTEKGLQNKEALFKDHIHQGKIHNATRRNAENKTALILPK